MSNETCACCGTADDSESDAAGPDDRAPADDEPDDRRLSDRRDDRGPDDREADDRWITDRPITEGVLPEDVQETYEQFLGAASIETLGDWVDELRRQVGGESVTVDHLCHSDEPTEHWGELDGERHYFRCFYDAVALAELADAPVDVRTEGPDGTVVEARASGDGDLEATPSDAVLSFGIAEDAGAASDGGPPSDAVPASDDGPMSDDGPTLEELYAAVCPYVRAFPDRAAYEAWAEAAPAATVGVPLADGIDVATRLVE